MKVLFESALGGFVLDGQKIVEQGDLKQLVKKYPDVRLAEETQSFRLLPLLKEPRYFTAFRDAHIRATLQSLRTMDVTDILITHAIQSVQEIDSVVHVLVKRCREWYGIYCPETRLITDNLNFVETIMKASKLQILEQFNISEAQALGVPLDKPDVLQMQLLAEEAAHLYHLRQLHETYLSSVLKRHCANMQELCGTLIAAKLIAKAGSLKRLALLPSSTVQLLGAEKALFRHLTRKARSPKHGLIVNHPLVQRVPRMMKGKAARALADKISMCARLDYFKGAFKAKEYMKALEERFQ